MSRPRVLGWTVPGDGTEPYPALYWVWFRLYRWTRRVKHRVGWHDWHERGVVDYDDLVYARRDLHCDWCGKSKPVGGSVDV